jgi:hypothetical protein
MQVLIFTQLKKYRDGVPHDCGQGRQTKGESFHGKPTDRGKEENIPPHLR